MRIRWRLGGAGKKQRSQITIHSTILEDLCPLLVKTDTLHSLFSLFSSGSKHGSSTGGYYACNNYTAMGSSGTLKGEAKAAYDASHVVEAQKARLAYYEFYVQRHVFMQNSANDSKQRNLQPLVAQIEACLSGQDGVVHDRHR